MAAITDEGQEAIHRFQQELFQFIHRRVGDYDIARDIHQDCLIKIYLNYSDLNNKASLKSWIYRIAQNSITDFYRQQKNRIGLPVDEFTQAEEPSGELDAGESELLACMKPFVDTLSTPYREALLKTDLGGMSQKEYAASLGKSYSGVKSTVQRARARLKQKFMECCRIESDQYGNILSVDKGKDCPC